MVRMKNPLIHLNDIKVRDKMLLLYIFSVIIPIIFTNLVFYRKISHSVGEREMQYIAQDMQKIKGDFKRIIDENATLSHAIYTDKNLYTFLDKHYESTDEYFSYYIRYLKNMQERYKFTFPNIYDINIYTSNPQVLNSAGYLRLTQEVRNNEWIKKLKKIKNQVLVYAHIREDFRGLKRVFSIIRKLDYYDKWDSYEKILKIDIQFNAIARIIEDRRVDGQIFLVNDANKIVYASHDSYYPEGSLEFMDFSQIHYDEKDLVIEEGFDSVTTLDDWKIVGVFSRQKIMNAYRQSAYFVFTCAAINLLVASFIIYLISRSFHYRIQILSGHIEKVRNQDFEVIHYEGGQDEIGQLIRDYNRMVIRIKELIQDVYKADIQRQALELENKQAQLDALQSQINPHFLFNTLETIRMRSLVKDERETAEIIKYLSRIFRRALAWGNDWVTVGEEVEFVENFLKIQQYRFEKRINYNISMEPGTEQLMIPKMTLQPLVENASIHGIEKIKDQGIIELDIRIIEDRLHMEVADNGVGIEKEMLAQIRKELKDQEINKEHIGIANVYWRLQLYYGESFSFNIESGENKGTKVTISIPLEYGPKIHGGRKG
ncbi:MAG: sensor histidine kinase [Caldicoprobacterales bacterium]|jgi:two-component system sensor histidine kinase YesM